MVKRLFLLAAILCFSAQTWAATPTLVQHSTGGNTGASTVSAGGTFNSPLPTAMLASNLVTVCVQNQAGKTPSSVTDGTNTYTNLVGHDDGNQNVTLWYSPGVTAGSQLIQIHYASLTSDVDVQVDEWFNAATSTPTDGSGTGSGSSTTLSLNVASLTTTVDGDLVIPCGVQDSARARITSWTKNASFTLLANDFEGTMVEEFEVQATHGAVSGTLVTMAPTHAWNMVAGAFKSATAGTAPATSGIRVIDLHHQPVSIAGTGASSTEGFPCHNAANLEIGGFIGVAADSPTTVTSSVGNTWTAANAVIVSGGSGNVRIYYSKIATCIDTDVITVTYGGTGALPGDTFWLFSVANANTSAPLDGTCGTATGTGSGTSVPTGSAFTPTATDLVVSVMGVTTNTVTGGAPGTFLSWTYSGEVSPAQADENNALKARVTASTTTDSWTTSGAAGAWASMSCGFLQAAAASGGLTGNMMQSGMGK